MSSLGLAALSASGFSNLRIDTLRKRGIVNIMVNVLNASLLSQCQCNTCNVCRPISISTTVMDGFMGASPALRDPPKPSLRATL